MGDLTSASEPSNPEPMVSNGSCLCGVIKYTLTGSPLTSIICHCSNCKKVSASSFMTHDFFQISVRSAARKRIFVYLADTISQQFKMIGSEDTIRTFEDKETISGNSISRSFCGICGSPCFIIKSANPNGIIIPVGVLEEHRVKEWKPAEEFFCGNRDAYLPSVKGTVEFETGRSGEKMEHVKERVV